MLRAQDITRLFELLNTELQRRDTRGELYLVGGAVMCVAHRARESTEDVDGYFIPTREVREAARAVAETAGLDPTWLNDGVKGFLSAQGDFAPFLQLSHLSVLIAEPEYLLAMKCFALRLGAEFHDLDDVRFLLRLLNVTTVDVASRMIAKYYPIERIPVKARFALAELLNEQHT